MRRVAIPFLLITTIITLLHWFIYSIVSEDFTTPPTWLAALLISGIVLMIGSLLLGMSPLHKKLPYLILTGHIWMGVFNLAFFFSFIQMFLSLLPVPLHSSWVLYTTVVISLWSLRINFFSPKVITHKLKGPEFLRGLRALQISDLHIGMPTLRQAWLQKVVDQIQAAKPDLVFVTGDLVDAPYEETAPLLEPLSQIQVPKFYVTGNHEYIRGGDWEARLASLGFDVLHNSHRIITRNQGSLLIGGVPDRSMSRARSSLESIPDKALASSGPVGYKILLAHEPGSVLDVKTETCDLLLAGHTHGGQIFPFAVFVRLVNPVVAGFKKINNILVFAHQGTGFWGPPMRWFTRSEIVIFEWE